MIVYVESNFVLELSLTQEQHDACDQILNLACSGHVSLRIPAYALLEPIQTLTRRLREWQVTAASVEQQLGQLARNASLRQEAEQLAGMMARATNDATSRHTEIRTRILKHACVLPVLADTLRESERLAETLGMSIHDAVMLASVESDLREHENPSLFLNSNSKDFSDPRIVHRLKEKRCKLMTSFSDAFSRIKAATRESRPVPL